MKTNNATKKEKIYAPENEELLGRYNQSLLLCKLFALISFLLTVAAVIMLVFAPLYSYSYRVESYDESETFFKTKYSFSALDAIETLLYDFTTDDQPHADVLEDVKYLQTHEINASLKALNLSKTINHIGDTQANVYSKLVSNAGNMSAEEKEAYKQNFYNELNKKIADILNIYAQEIEMRNLDGVKIFHNSLETLYAVSNLAGGDSLSDSFMEEAAELKEKYLVGDYVIDAAFCASVFEGENALDMSILPAVLVHTEYTTSSPFFTYNSTDDCFNIKHDSSMPIFLIEVFQTLFVILGVAFLFIDAIAFIVIILKKKYLPTSCPRTCAVSAAVMPLLHILLVLLVGIFAKIDVLCTYQYCSSGFGVGIGVMIGVCAIAIACVALEILRARQVKKTKQYIEENS